MRTMVFFLMAGCAVDEGPLGINEVGPDWIEVYSDAPETRSLEGWTLEMQGALTTLEAMDVAPGEAVLLPLTMFQIPEAGAELVLTDADGELVQVIDVPPLDAVQSYGRVPDGVANWQILETASPGELNGEGL